MQDVTPNNHLIKQMLGILMTLLSDNDNLPLLILSQNFLKENILAVAYCLLAPIMLKIIRNFAVITLLL